MVTEKVENYLNVDYLTVTAKVEDGNNAGEFLQMMLNVINKDENVVDSGSIEFLDKGVNLYAKTIRVLKFFSIFYENYQKDSDTICLQISGEGLSRLSEDQLVLLKLNLYHRNVKCSRIDFAYTDFNHTMPVKELLQDFTAWGNNDEHNKIRTKKYKSSFRIYQQTDRQYGMSTSVTLGTRRSDSFVRLYDKRLERNWDIPYCYRLEYELHRIDAERYFKEWATNKMTLADIYVNLLYDVFNPVYSTSLNISAAKIKPYWQRFIDHFLENKNEYQRVGAKSEFCRIRDVETMMKWVERISATFFTYISIDNGNLTALLKKGESRALSNKFYRQLLVKPNVA